VGTGTPPNMASKAIVFKIESNYKLHRKIFRWPLELIIYSFRTYIAQNSEEIISSIMLAVYLLITFIKHSYFVEFK
jgi:hypothetical protein